MTTRSRAWAFLTIVATHAPRVVRRFIGRQLYRSLR